MPSNKLFEAIRNLFLDFEFFIGGLKIEWIPDFSGMTKWVNQCASALILQLRSGRRLRLKNEKKDKKSVKTSEICVKKLQKVTKIVLFLVLIGGKFGFDLKNKANSLACGEKSEALNPKS
jgi:hypothetical protein